SSAPRLNDLSARPKPENPTALAFEVRDKERGRADESGRIADAWRETQINNLAGDEEDIGAHEDEVSTSSAPVQPRRRGRNGAAEELSLEDICGTLATSAKTNELPLTFFPT